jgi:hypothetical protein
MIFESNLPTGKIITASRQFLSKSHRKMGYNLVQDHLPEPENSYFEQYLLTLASVVREYPIASSMGLSDFQLR